MRRSLLKTLVPGAPQRPAFLVRGLGLGHVALRRLPMVPCAALHATGIDSALHSARLRQAAGGPLRVLKSRRAAPLSLLSTNSSSTNSFLSFTSNALFGVLCTGLATGASLAGLYFQHKETTEAKEKTVETSEATREQLEVEAILAARAASSAADELHAYVQRVDLEKKLESFLRKPTSTAGSYMVVVGPRGAGKSTLVSHVLNEMGEGVLVVPIKDQTTDVEALVLKVALDQYKPLKDSVHTTSTPLKNGVLAERLKAAADAGCKKRGEKGWRPTLVLEITQSGDKDLIKSACNLLKLVTHDKPLCHGILVLSSSFAVAELPQDEYRQCFLRVGAFSRDEAAAHLDANLKANLPVEDATVAAVAAVKERTLQLTTLPKILGGLTEAVLGSESEEDFRARAEAWASEFEEKARTDVEGLHTKELNDLFRDKIGQECRWPMRDLMRKLLETGAPVRLPTDRFNLSSATFASIIRTSQEAKAAFNVDLVSKTVDFASAAHRKAAAEDCAAPAAGFLIWLFGGRR